MGEIKANSKDDVLKLNAYINSNGCVDKKNIVYQFAYRLRRVGVFEDLEEALNYGTLLNQWTKKKNQFSSFSYIIANERIS